MAYPPRTRVYLLKFYLMRGYRCSQAIEYEEPGTRCALVYCTDEGIPESLFVPLGTLQVLLSVLDLMRIGRRHCDERSRGARVSELLLSYKYQL